MLPNRVSLPVDVNLYALINGTRLGYRAMRANPQPNGGVIVNIASLGGFLAQPYSAVYSATKHAVVGYVRSLGYLRKQGVRVVGLAPGFTDTNLVASGTAESPPFRAMITQATKHSGGLMTVDDVVTGAFMLIDDPKMGGHVLSVSREMGFALHDTPMLSPKGADGQARSVALPHRTLRPLQAKL
jgi:short-subunit dehydrogenase